MSTPRPVLPLTPFIVAWFGCLACCGGTAGGGEGAAGIGGDGHTPPDCAPGATSPECEEPTPLPVCPVAFVEPEAPCEPPRPNDWPGWDLFMSFTLPAESHCGESHSEYWLTGDEPVVLDLLLETDGDEPDRPVEVVALVDGLATPFAIDGGAPSLRYTFTMPAHASRTLHLELAGVAPGKHFLNVLVIYGQRTLAVPTASLVVFRDATCNDAELPPPVETRSAAVQEGWSCLVDRTTGGSLGFLAMEVTPRDGRIPLTLHLAGTDLMPSDRYVVAWLDGRQVPLGNLGDRPRFAIQPDSDDREVDFELFAPIVNDGQIHRGAVFQIGWGDDLGPASPSGPSPRPYAELLGAFFYRG